MIGSTEKLSYAIFSAIRRTRNNILGKIFLTQIWAVRSFILTLLPMSCWLWSSRQRWSATIHLWMKAGTGRCWSIHTEPTLPGSYSSFTILIVHHTLLKKKYSTKKNTLLKKKHSTHATQMDEVIVSIQPNSRLSLATCYSYPSGIAFFLHSSYLSHPFGPKVWHY